MKRLLLSTAAAAVFAAAVPAAADTATEEVVVTATRLPSPLELAPGARVIERAEIDRRGAVFAEEILQTVPGLSVFSNGAFGGVTSARMRGATSDKTLVLVDGVPLNDPSQPSGGFDFSGFDLADVQRIEILSGPQGSLWGSDAIGGVISFTTREADGLRAELEGGSYGTVRGAVSVGERREAWALGLSVAGLRSDGISKADEDDGHAEADAYDSLTAGLSGRVRLSDAVELDARLRWQRSQTEVDGYPAPSFSLADTDDVAESESWSGLVRATVQGPLGFEHRLSLSAYDLDRSQDGESFPWRYTAERRVWRWTAERDQAQDRWGLALGVEREDTEADLSAGRGDLGATAVFGVVSLRPVERLHATLSLRRDAPDGYDAETTARAAAVYDLGAGFRLKGSFGQGFKTPSISQTACDFCFPAGPADLTPEKAEGWDLGLAWEQGRFDAAVTGYALDVEDQIAWSGGRYVNIAKTRSRGVEAEGGAALGGGFDLRASYAYTDAVDATTGARLQRVPEHQGSLSLWWTGERGRAAVTVRGESEQLDVAPDFSPADRDGFVTADLTAGWALTDQVEATLKLKNLTDADYQEVLGFGEPGRSAYVGLRLRY